MIRSFSFLKFPFSIIAEEWFFNFFIEIFKDVYSSEAGLTLSSWTVRQLILFQISRYGTEMSKLRMEKHLVL